MRQAAGKLLTACKFNCTRCIKHQREYTKHYISKIYNVVFFEIWLHRAAAGNETAVDNWPFLQIPTGLWQLSVMGSVWLSPPSLRAAWFLSVRCDGLGSPNFSVQTGTLRFWSRTKAFQGREKRKASALYQLHRLKPAYVDRIYHSATELPMQLQAPKRHLRGNIHLLRLYLHHLQALQVKVKTRIPPPPTCPTVYSVWTTSQSTKTIYLDSDGEWCSETGSNLKVTYCDA